MNDRYFIKCQPQLKELSFLCKGEPVSHSLIGKLRHGKQHIPLKTCPELCLLCSGIAASVRHEIKDNVLLPAAFQDFPYLPFREPYLVHEPAVPIIHSSSVHAHHRCPESGLLKGFQCVYIAASRTNQELGPCSLKSLKGTYIPL